MAKDSQHAALIEAVKEAARFIERANDALATDQPWSWQSASKATAKRASMDLTRALAKFRQARY